MSTMTESSFIIVNTEEDKALLESLGLTMFKEKTGFNGITSFYFVNEPRKLQRVNFETGHYLFTNKLDF